jgi:hypothetical protein
VRGQKQAVRAVKTATIVSPALNRQAKNRLFRGLERFTNTGDSIEEYKVLAKAWPSLWPLNLRDSRDSQERPLAWSDMCHALFLVYRDVLRRVWASEREAVLGGPSVGFLLGIGGQFDAIAGGISVGIPKLNEVWNKIRNACPGAFVASSALVWPEWRSGDFTYYTGSEFELALYSLFRESWRAKVCARCSTYFVAQKPPQLYCSVECSNATHQKSALKWWRETGAKRRASQKGRRPKQNRRERKHR